MASGQSLRAICASALILSMVISTTSLSAAEVASSDKIVGSVRARGVVQLRGMPVKNEGTVFQGDEVRSQDKSQADVMLADGNKIELFANTGSKISRSNNVTHIDMSAGNMGFFASSKPFVVSVGAYEVLPQAQARGGVAFLSDDLVGFRAMSGNLRVRNITTNTQVDVTAGKVYVVSLKKQQEINPVQLASMAPPSLPTTLPQGQRPPDPAQQPAGQTRPPDTSINWKLWGPVLAGIGAGSTVAILEATKCDSSASPSKPC
jgi:hypothetical protein